MTDSEITNQIQKSVSKKELADSYVGIANQLLNEKLAGLAAVRALGKKAAIDTLDKYAKNDLMACDCYTTAAMYYSEVDGLEAQTAAALVSAGYAIAPHVADRAIELLIKAKNLYSMLNQSFSLAGINESLGELLRSQKRYGMAAKCYEDAFKIYREQNCHKRYIKCLIASGTMYLLIRSISMSATYFKEALAACNTSRDSVITLLILCDLQTSGIEVARDKFIHNMEDRDSCTYYLETIKMFDLLRELPEDLDKRKNMIYKILNDYIYGIDDEIKTHSINAIVNYISRAV